MNDFTLDQKSSVGFNKEANAIAKGQRKTGTSIPKGSILERLIDLAFSIPDFRRTNMGNIRHQLGDIVMLMILARMSRCVRRADIIGFGKHNLRKLQSLGLLNNGVPSERTLCSAALIATARFSHRSPISSVTKETVKPSTGSMV